MIRGTVERVNLAGGAKAVEFWIVLDQPINGKHRALIDTTKVDRTRLENGRAVTLRRFNCTEECIMVQEIA